METDGRKYMRGWVSRVVVTLVVLLLLPGVSHALTDEQNALVGLQGVHVVVFVEKMNPQAEKHGLTKAQIQSDVELRLRKAGVKVLTMIESIETPEMPLLYVVPSILIMPDLNVCFVSIEVGLLERVTLASGVDKVPGRIWSKGYMGTVGIDKITQIRGIVGDKVDIFINDYLAANPKK